MRFTGAVFLFIASLAGVLCDNLRAGDNGSIDRYLQEGVALSLKITNLSYQQPLGGFFVMVHGKGVEPIFIEGNKARDDLQALAENGDPSDLVGHYDGAEGVFSAEAFPPPDGQPLPGGASFEIEVQINKDYNLITLASMAVNTNDCFVALQSEWLYPGKTAYSPGFDSGTEINDELCISIPGPACADSPGNIASGDGEGFVHIHRGFHGVGPDLSQAGYDWRNPMMKVTASLAT